MDTKIVLQDYFDWLYECASKCTEERFNVDMANLHTKEALEEIFKCVISEEDINRVKSLFTEKYKGERLYAYCCGSLIITPTYHSDV